MNGCIAVINAGSSSIKFALYDAGSCDSAVFRGQIEQIGVSPHLRATNAARETVAEKRWPAEGFDHRHGTREIIETCRDLIHGAPVVGIGHRVVHGGTQYATPVRVDEKVLSELAALAPLAPLHQPHNLAPIAAIAEAAPHIPQAASRKWRRCSHCRANTPPPVSGATASTACPASTSPRACTTSRRNWRRAASSSPTSAMAPVSAPWTAAAASRQRWGSPQWMAS